MSGLPDFAAGQEPGRGAGGLGSVEGGDGGADRGLGAGVSLARGEGSSITATLGLGISMAVLRPSSFRL